MIFGSFDQAPDGRASRGCKAGFDRADGEPSRITRDMPNAVVNGNTLESLADVERAHIDRVLKAVGGNRTEAAKILGISRQTLRVKLALNSPHGSGDR